MRAADSVLKRLRQKMVIPIVILVLLGASLISIGAYNWLRTTPYQRPELFVGVDIAYGGKEEAIKVIDEVADYTNLIILGSLALTQDTPRLMEVCEHMFQKGLHFIIYVGFADNGYTPPRGPSETFFIEAKERWGERFLGMYIFDEIGGKLIDGAHSISLDGADTNTDAASIYVHHLYFYLNNVTSFYHAPDTKIFTSDYALYWFDYLSGYDVVFGEFVGNQSRQLAVALTRGAGRTLDKEWGTMITWQYMGPPFLPNPDLLYEDMVLAYQNGANYIIVFNSPENQTATSEFGTLTPEHLSAMRQFWDYVEENPDSNEFAADTAYVLPADYGYGFRGPDDGLWDKQEPDGLSNTIWTEANNLLDTYGMNLDIIYENEIGAIPVLFPYNRLIFWNGTIIER